MIYVQYVLNLSINYQYVSLSFSHNQLEFVSALFMFCSICTSFLTSSLHLVPAVPNHHAIFCPRVTYAHNFRSLNWPTLCVWTTRTFKPHLIPLHAEVPLVLSVTKCFICDTVCLHPSQLISACQMREAVCYTQDN